MSSGNCQDFDVKTLMMHGSMRTFVSACTFFPRRPRGDGVVTVNRIGATIAVAVFRGCEYLCFASFLPEAGTCCSNNVCFSACERKSRTSLTNLLLEKVRKSQKNNKNIKKTTFSFFLLLAKL